MSVAQEQKEGRQAQTWPSSARQMEASRLRAGSLRRTAGTAGQAARTGAAKAVHACLLLHLRLAGLLTTARVSCLLLLRCC